MNIDEKNPSQNESVEENNEIQEPKKSGLPLGALIGIIGGAVAVIVAVVLIILLSGNKSGTPCEHVDADDDYLCDRCGEHFDDGDEAADIVDKVDVSFIVKFEDGSVLSGAKFVLTRNDQTYEFVSGADGSVKGTVKIGKYYLDFDHETIPEYCLCNTPGLDIKEDTTTMELVIVDNRPDGSAKKPFPFVDGTMEITVAPGEDIYYSCHGTGLRYVSINSEALVINYNGNTYSADENGVVTIGISASNVETPTIFSVKNISDSEITTEMHLYSPIGSSDNPRETESGSVTAIVPNEKTEYYLYVAEKDGVLVVTSSTVGNSISLERYIVVVTEYGTEEIIPIQAGSLNGSAYIYVKQGEEIKIGISLVTPKNAIEVPAAEDDNKSFKVDFEINVYEGSEADPVPVFNSEINIRLEAYQSIVFESQIGKNVGVSNSKDIDLVYNNASVHANQSGKLSVTLTDNTHFTVINKADENKDVNIDAYATLGTVENPVVISGSDSSISVSKGECVYYSYTVTKAGKFSFEPSDLEVIILKQGIELIGNDGVYTVVPVSSEYDGTDSVTFDVLAGDVIVFAITNNTEENISNAALTFVISTENKK
ncbi:MAG: hypothetical protein IKW53_02830 [Clostridia bacterium]|nr:hypothetical protein [Clostridia bacterium]